MESEVREQVDVNCFSFVFHRLGLTPQEKYISPIDIHLNDYFEETDNPVKADAVAVIPKSKYGLDVPPEHIALVDTRRPSRVIQRPSPGEPEENVGIETIFGEYGSDQKLRIAFLKLKEGVKERVPA